jgi:fatty-acyl-CoA synthase
MPSDWNFATIFEGVAERCGNRPAVLEGDRVLSWAAFDQRADALARHLEGLGLARGAKIAVYLRNCTEFLESYYAALKIGLVPVNVNYRYGPDELVYLLDDSDTEAVVVHAEFAETVREIMPRLPRVRRWLLVGDAPEAHAWPAPELVERYEDCAGDLSAERSPDWAAARSGDDQMLVYTGGTTGLPKGVMWRQGDLFEALVGSSRAAFHLPPVTTTTELLDSLADPGPRGLSASPFMHGTGLLHQFVMLMSGGTSVVLTGHRFDARHLWGTVARHRVTAVVIVGDAFARPMVDVLDQEADSFDLSALEVISSSGALWSRPVKEALLRHLPGISVFDSLASSEGFGLATSVATAGHVEETTRFTLGPHVRVLGDDGSWLSPGGDAPGRLVVTGPLPLGYYKDPVKTAATFREIDGERYSMPGDYVRVLADSTVSFLGRGSACINTGGEKVYAEEVEHVVKAHPAVADAAVVGVPDDRFGSVVAAVVRLAPGAALAREELTRFVAARLAGYKAPRALYLVDDVPRTVQGKVDYRAIADRVTGGAPPVTTSASI